MPAIRLLDSQTIGRIAAGEVVERPASIAKELIENSLDAGATSVTLEIREGGVEYLRVTDNGCGIRPEEVRLAFENHATSKISSGDKLVEILTMGFRGEALASISAVARVTMTTRARGTETGVKVSVEGGRIVDISEAGCPEGTTVVVRDLFFNTPARRAFMKRAATEAGAALDVAAQLALGNPGVSIRAINNGKTIYHSFGDGELRHAALVVYGRETAERLVEVDEIEGGLHIFGLVGYGEASWPNRSAQSFFINGRVVRCRLVSQALEAAVRGRVMIGRYPMCALNLSLPPGSVDVNVHPNKLEVRFRDEDSVRMGVEALLSRAFSRGEVMLDAPSIAVQPPANVQPSPPIRVEAPDPEEAPEQIKISLPAGGRDMKAPPPPDEYRRLNSVASPARAQGTGLVMPGEDAVLNIEAGPRAEASDEADGEIRVIGVFDDTYILAELSGALIIIDQHAAHERILYEKYEAAAESGQVAQRLLVPIILPLSATDRALLEDNKDALLAAGYEVEPFGERDVRVLSVPQVLGEAQLKPVFADFLTRLPQLRGAAREKRRSELVMAACKHAVKAGDHLSDMEIRALIDDMRATGAPPSCPHGRPVIKVLRRHDMEAMFKRV